MISRSSLIKLKSYSIQNSNRLLNPLVKRLHNEYSNPEEIRIPVPYGHIAGKAWGKPGGKPILGLHGWLDNAATHDKLAVLLPPGYRFVSLDQPGHGKSSHYPPGMHYKLSDLFTFLQTVVDYLHWEKFSIIGHSLGGGVACWYTALFPEKVEKVVSIDLISFGALCLNKHVDRSRKSVQETVRIGKVLSSGKVPVYTFEDACGRAFMASNILNGLGAMTKESVEILLSRGLVEVPGSGGYTWSHDLRLRIPTAFNLVQEVAEEYGSRISCPHLFIKATNSTKYMTDENFNRMLKVYRNNNPNFIYREVEGGHHLHLNTPEKVSVLINSFLEKTFTNPESENAKFDLI